MYFKAKKMITREITVAFDGGTSSTKAIASYPTKKCPINDEGYFLLSSSVRELTKQTYIDLLQNVEEGVGLDTSLVSFVHPATNQTVYWQTGTIAKAGLLSVRERKFETLIIKIIAFVGYLASCSGIDRDVELNLGILLPLDEIKDRQLICQWLRKIISSREGFIVDGLTINNLKIKRMNCKPEGYGIFKNSKSDRTGILMMGHSDWSWLYFGRGSFCSDLSKTFPGSGMHDFIKNIGFSIQEEIAAARVIAEAGTEYDESVLIELTQTRSKDELDLLVNAIKAVHPQYWKERESEIDTLSIERADTVLVAGGAAYYFTSKLNSLFLEKYDLKLDWCKSLKKEFSDRFAVKKSNKSIPLLLDCFGYFKFISEPKSVSASVENKKTILKVS